MEEVEGQKDTELVAEAIEIIKGNKELSSNEKIFLTYTLLGFKPLEIAEFNGWNRAKMYRIKAKAMGKLNKIFKSN